MKGQVTIFLILLIVAVIVSSVLISTHNKKQLAIMQESEDVNLKQVTPVKIYIEDIMQDLLVEGLFLIGKQGGKIYKTTWPDCKEENKNYTIEYRMCNQSGVYDYGFPKYLEKSPYQHKRVGIGINHSRIDPANRVTYSSDEPLEQPFAYPHEGKNIRANYLYGAEQPLPSITSETGPGSIENQLSRWIEYHFTEELNLTEFEERGFVIQVQEGRPKVNVEINEDFITAKMNYTLNIKKAESDYILKEYNTEIVSDFRLVYEGIQEMIRQDISTKSVMFRQKVFNESGKQIARVIYPAIESIPQNFMYDIINITVWSINYTKRYGHESPFGYYWFYFIRENRPPDADIVKAPQVMYVNEYAMWTCSNMKTNGGQAAFDPDEDDEWSKQPFPWFTPKWYQFYSRGDQLIVNLPTPNPVECKNDKELEHQINLGLLRFHNEPYSKDFGSGFVENGLGACGNKDEMVTVIANSLSDVGDVIILKVADEQESDKGDKITAPDRYKEPEIKEEGTGRLNDVMSYRLVKCRPSDGELGCCSPDGFWRFNERPLNRPDAYVDLCFAACVNQYQDNVAGDPCSCDCSSAICTDYRRVYKICNHEGQLVLSYKGSDQIKLEPEGTECTDCPCN